jgi:mannose-6-phosphate isomerase-like protein (cupin superfamily)
MGLTVTTSESTLPPGEPLELAGLLAFADHGIASRVLAKSSGGNVTLFTFSPFDALVFILEGTMALTIGNRLARASAGTVTRMPASIPHALQAEETHPYAPRDAS